MDISKLAPDWFRAGGSGCKLTKRWPLFLWAGSGCITLNKLTKNKRNKRWFGDGGTGKV